MNKQQQMFFKGNRLEEVVRGYPGIYKVWVWDLEKKKYIDPSTIPFNQQKLYRVKKRISVFGKSLRMSKYFSSIEEAKAWKNLQASTSNSEMMEASHTIAKPSYTLSNLISDWRGYTKPPRLKLSTWLAYEKDVMHLKPLLEMIVEKIKAPEIDLWIQMLTHPTYPRAGCRISYVREVKVLGLLLRWYREYKNPEYNVPLLKRHLRDAQFQETPLKESKAMTAIELELFLENIQKHPLSVYYYLASFQVLTGVRIGEACGLAWDCVDLDQGWVTIKRIVWWDNGKKTPRLREGTKTDSLRRIRLCDRAREILLEWKQKSTEAYFVFHDKGEALRYRMIQHMYNQAFRWAKLPYRSTHILRHTFATLFVAQTRNREALRSILGHTSFSMTEKYAHSSELTQEDAIHSFHLGRGLRVIEGGKSKIETPSQETISLVKSVN